jgi:hypothetical protein
MSALLWKSDIPKGCEAHWAAINYQRYKTEINLVWLSKADFSGKRGVTYHADNLISYGAGDRNRCWLIVIGPKGGKRSLSLGCYKTMDEAKRACEQHWADGCDLTGTQPELTWACDRAAARAMLAAASA